MDEATTGLILVVEDDDALRETIVLTLEYAGLRVEAAADGAQALACIEKRMPDLILLDMRMPLMDGWEFARQFHARYDALRPIIVVTAAEDARRRAEEIQACCSIGKPFDVDALTALVTQHLNGAAHRVGPPLASSEGGPIPNHSKEQFMAEQKDILKQLVSLAQLDVDAIFAYSSSIEHIDIVDVKARLIEFRSDHERHVSDLAPFIQKFGGEVPKHAHDFKGFFIQGFTAIRSMMGNEGAIKAMKGNEELTNKHYDKALEFDFPVDVRQVIERNRDDERRHLAYINQCIDSKIWDRKKVA